MRCFTLRRALVVAKHAGARRGTTPAARSRAGTALASYGRSSVGSFWCWSLQNGTALTCPVFASRIQYL